MSDKSKIEWTDATWNPVRGCVKVSEGCHNCYAARVAARFSGEGMPYHGLAEMTPHGPRWTGAIRLVPEVLDQPLRWKKPRRIFVNSMSDLFHEAVPDEFIQQVWETMAGAPWHIFQILTKRPHRMMEWVKKYGAHIVTGEPALKNVWLGVSVENQKAADERIPLLLQTPAAIRFLSCEPLLGPVDLSKFKPFDGECLCQDSPDGCKPRLAKGCPESSIDWVIVGGESGPDARPMHPDWVRSIRDQCVAAGVPFFMKQWGEWKETDFSEPIKTPRTFINAEGHRVNQLLHDPLSYVHMVRVGKKSAGRLLDGRTWDEFPVVAQ